MKVWLHATSTHGRTSYIHVFTGSKNPDKEGYIIIDKSLLEFGDHAKRQNFQRPGEEIFVGRSSQHDIETIKHWAIEQMFYGSFDLSRSFRAGRK